MAELIKSNEDFAKALLVAGEILKSNEKDLNDLALVLMKRMEEYEEKKIDDNEFREIVKILEKSDKH